MRISVNRIAEEHSLIYPQNHLRCDTSVTSWVLAVSFAFLVGDPSPVISIGQGGGGGRHWPPVSAKVSFTSLGQNSRGFGFPEERFV